jgi:hypothetical protein
VCVDPTTDVNCLRNYVEVCPRGPKYVTQFQYKNPSPHPRPPIRHFKKNRFATFPLPSSVVEPEHIKYHESGIIG